MPRYFTDLQIDDLRIRDKKGSDTACVKDARNEAVEALRVAINDRARSEDECFLSATVRDEHGMTLYEATLSFKGRYGSPRCH